MTIGGSDLHLDSDLDSIRNSCDICDIIMVVVLHLRNDSSKRRDVFEMFDTKAVFFRMADHVCPSSFLLCSSSSFDGIIRDCLCQPSRDIPVCPRSRLTLQHIVKVFLYGPTLCHRLTKEHCLYTINSATQ